MTGGSGDGQVRAYPLDCPAALRGDPAPPYNRGSLCNNNGAVYHDNRVRVDRVGQEAI